jgi:hypothetical protein
MATSLRESSILRTCAAPGCRTFTLGNFCVGHEPVRPLVEFPRGRPFARPAVELRPQLLRLPRNISAK